MLSKPEMLQLPFPLAFTAAMISLKRFWSLAFSRIEPTDEKELVGYIVR